MVGVLSGGTPSCVSGPAAASCTGGGAPGPGGGIFAEIASGPDIGWSVMQPAIRKTLATRTAPDVIRDNACTRITLPPTNPPQRPLFYRVSYGITIGDSSLRRRGISATARQIQRLSTGKSRLFSVRWGGQ